MLKDMELLLERNETLTEEALEDAALMLLSRQFVYADDHGMGCHWDTITRHRVYFTNLFDALGLELHVRETERMAGITWRRRPGRWLLRTDEALVLLTLRLIREEALTAYRIGDYGEVESSTEELFARYEERTRRQRPSASRCRDILTGFQQRGLVHVDDAIDERNLAITIRPAILLAVDQKMLDVIELYAAKTAAAAALGTDEDEG